MTSIVLTTSLFFISCDFKKDNSTKFDDSPRIELLELNNGNEVLLRIDYYGTYSFKNWNAYNLVNTELHRIEGINYKTSLNRILNLDKGISSLRSTILNWLKTEEVMEDIDGVQKEYSFLLNERNGSKQKVKQNLEKFTGKFDDLRQELSETVGEFSA